LAGGGEIFFVRFSRGGGNNTGQKKGALWLGFFTGPWGGLLGAGIIRGKPRGGVRGAPFHRTHGENKRGPIRLGHKPQFFRGPKLKGSGFFGGFRKENFWAGRGGAGGKTWRGGGAGFLGGTDFFFFALGANFFSPWGAIKIRGIPDVISFLQGWLGET